MTGVGILSAAEKNARLPLDQGHWVAKKADCKDDQGLFFDYKGESMDFNGFSCQIKQVRHYGGIRYLLDMDCVSKAIKFEDTIAIDISRDKSVFVHYPNIGSNSDEFRLCSKFRKSGQTVVAKKQFEPSARLISTSNYEGNVGKSSVEATLNFYRDGRVIGKYVTQLLGNVYQLEGENPSDGVLVLKEYTNGKHTANVKLDKNVRDGKLAWIGKMHNLDGRIVDVFFVKKL